MRAAKRERTLQVKTLDEVHREYLASRGVTIITIKGKGGSLVEAARLTPNAKLKVLTARDYVNIAAKLLASEKVGSDELAEDLRHSWRLLEQSQTNDGSGGYPREPSGNGCNRRWTLAPLASSVAPEAWSSPGTAIRYW